MTLVYRSREDEQAREFEKLFPGRTVLLYDPRLEHSGSSVGNLFRAVDPSERTVVDLIVIRGDSGLAERAAEDRVLTEVVADTPAYTLATAADGTDAPVLRALQPSNDPVGAGRFGPPADVIAQLRAGEVEAVLVHWSAVWHSDENVHYELPSGEHADVFIRIAEALADPLDVARVADWLLPYLSPGLTILADTGGMLALLLQLKLVAHQRRGWTIGIDTLARYPRGAVEIREILWTLEPSVRGDGKLLFLLSVNSSGSLLSMIRTLVPRGRLTVVALCDTAPAATQPSGLDALTTVEVNRWEVGADGHCVECENKKTFQIDARSYERVPYLGVPKPVEIDMTRAARHQDLWEAAQRTRAVALHHNAAHPPDARHHPVYVDVSKLLGDDAYRSRALRTLTEAVRAAAADLVLLVEHDATPALASLLGDALEALPDLPPPTILVVSASAPFSDGASTAIRAATAILLIDDAVVTGTTVVRLRERIYKLQKAGRRNAPVDLFTVLRRPHDPSVVRNLNPRYTTVHGRRAVCVDELYLPAAGTQNCPWCRELELLRLLLPSLPGFESELTDRIDHLLHSPLTAPLLMGDGPDAAELRTEESFWGTLDEVTAFAAVTSSALDVMVTVDEPDPSFRQRYASLRLVFAAYYDAIIRAAALRTAQRRQLRHVAQDNQVPGWIDQIDDHSATPGLLSELAYAAAVTKLPAGPVLTLLRRMQPSPHVDLLLAIVDWAINPAPAADRDDVRDDPTDPDDDN